MRAPARFAAMLLLAVGTAAAQQSTYVPATSTASKPKVSDSIQYVSNSGSDWNDGLSWGTAKATIGAACAAIGSNSSCATNAEGSIFVSPGYSGTLPGLSTQGQGVQVFRLGVVGGTSGSPYTGNEAWGTGALWANVPGNVGSGFGIQNTALGYHALLNNSTGCSSGPCGELNTAVGFRALLNNTTGYENTAVGNDTLEGNTSGESNMAFGQDALNGVHTSNNNVAMGAYAAQGEDGGDVTAVGDAALYNLTTGSFNIGLGEQAGVSLTTGSRNMFIGNYSTAKAAADTDEMVIAAGGTYSGGGGTQTVGAGSHTAVIGDSAVTDVYLGSATGAATAHVNCLQVGGTSGPTWCSGSSTPSGSCTNGSLFSNTSGSSGSTLYACVAGAWTDIK